jgi:serine/threonine-protein kinase
LEVTPVLHLLRPIGEGGMGKVWIAQHKALETEVVVKFLAAAGLDREDREDAEARFKREAAAAAAVKSPHVVQVFDHGTTPGGLRYIVMEHLEGRDLAAHIAAKGPMAPRDVAAVVSQVAKALSKAHSAGVIHRDVKPENIFLCDGEAGEMFVKVLDFGVAKRERELTAKTTTGQIIGTPFYMSPEQLLAERPVDARTDIWALGIVVYEALTGKRPYQGATIGALALAIHHAAPKPSELVPTLPPALDDWFARACARDPDQRFSTVREAAQAMTAAVAETESGPTLVRPTMTSVSDISNTSLAAHVVGDSDNPNLATTNAPGSYEVPMKRRPPALLLGAAAFAILVLLIVVGLALRPSTPPRPTQNATEPTASATSAPSAAVTVASAIETAAPAASETPKPTPTPTASATPTATATTAATPRPRPGSATPRPPPAPTAKPSARPPRRPNDDDIK